MERNPRATPQPVAHHQSKQFHYTNDISVCYGGLQQIDMKLHQFCVESSPIAHTVKPSPATGIAPCAGLTISDSPAAGGWRPRRAVTADFPQDQRCFTLVATKSGGCQS
jgi:hypothetical protein